MRNAFRNSRSGVIRRLLSAAAVVCVPAITAHAELWTVVNLHPDGAEYSRALGVSGGQQVGYAYYGGNVYHAGLWSGSASSWVDLTPTGSTYAVASDAYGSQQVGEVGGHASLWTGSAASYVDLNPTGAPGSAAGTGAGAAGCPAPLPAPRWISRSKDSASAATTSVCLPSAV